jgi:hypothetical protein
MTSGGLVIVGAIEIIVPLITARALSMLLVSAMIFNPIASVSAMDDVSSISYTLTLATLI